MLTNDIIRFAALLLVACAATLLPDMAWAALPAGTGNVPLANITPAQLKTLTGADVKRIPELNLWLKIGRAVTITIGSGIGWGGFMMFGTKSENPNTTGLVIALLSAAAIIIGGFFFMPDIVAMVLRQMA